jgi:aminoglycoside 3-N-acetyltransferase
VIRTNHPTHSVAICGELRDALNAGVELDDTPMGVHSPYRKIAKYGGKILMLGCSLDHNSFMHGVEELVGAPYALRGHQEYTVVDPDGNVSLRRIRRHNFTRLDGIHIYQRYDRTLDVLDTGDYIVGQIHGADAILLNAAVLEDKAVKKLKQEPLFFIDDPHGLYCHLR